MNYFLKNKVVIVTGGANGIGYSIVDKYLEQQAKVVLILDIDELEGNEAVQTLTKKYGEGKVDFIKCDVTTDLEHVLKIIMDKYKMVDVLVLNAGMARDEIPRQMIDVLFSSVIEWSLQFSEYMRKDKAGKGGTILINSSIFGFRTAPFSSVYQASKSGVLGFAKSLGHEHNFQKTGIRVVAMCPGITETKLSRPLHDPELKNKNPDQELIKFAEAQPWQKVEAVGNAAVEIFEKAKSGTVWVIEGDKLSILT